MSEEQWRSFVLQAFESGDGRMGRMEAAITDNTVKVGVLAEKTGQMYEVFNGMAGGFKVLEWLAKGVKWGAIIVGAIAALFKALGWKWPWQ